MSGAIFERHEMKFLLNMRQRRFLESAIQGRMRPDEHGESTICNIYYDTPNYLLVRRSLEGPVYKEKIRMRSYGPACGSDPVFLELKKKYKGVVYKRRISIPLDEAEAYMHFGRRCHLRQYTKLCTLLVQNLRRGNDTLLQVLQEEAESSFEERKNLARELGEEAGTRLLFPMMIMLGITMLIIIVPAYFSFSM